MARPLDSITKDTEGFVRVGDIGGTVLFRIVHVASGDLVHIRLGRNCRQVVQRGDPDFYIPWDEFKEVIERNQ